MTDLADFTSIGNYLTKTTIKLARNIFPVDVGRVFLPNVYKLNVPSKKSIKTAGTESPQEIEIFTVHKFEGLSFIFYKDEFKVYLNTLEEMRLPLVT